MSHSFIFVTLCVLIMVAAGTTSMPTGASSSESETAPLHQVYNGLQVVRTMIKKKLLMDRDAPAPAVRVDHAACMCGVDSNRGHIYILE